MFPCSKTRCSKFTCTIIIKFDFCNSYMIEVFFAFFGNVQDSIPVVSQKYLRT